MRFSSFCSYLVFAITLSACSDGSGGPQNAVNPQNVSVDVTSEVLSLSGTGINVSVPNRNEPLGSFETGETLDPEADFQFVATSVNDATFATILITEADGTAAQTFYGRTEGIDAFPTGSAIYTGSYVGTFQESNGGTLNARIQRDAQFQIDFDDMTVAGILDNGRTPLFGLTDSFGNPLLFTLSYSMLLDQTDIKSNGTFSGNVTLIENGTTIFPGAGEFAGAFGGTTAGEIVGEIRVFNEDREPEQPEFSEVGVFSVTE